MQNNNTNTMIMVKSINYVCQNPRIHEGFNLLGRKVNSCFGATQEPQDPQKNDGAQQQTNTTQNPRSTPGAFTNGTVVHPSMPEVFPPDGLTNTPAGAPTPTPDLPDAARALPEAAKEPENTNNIVPKERKRHKKFKNRDRIKKQNQGEIPALTYEQALQDLQSISQSQNPERDQALLACIFLTGCRISEITRFKPNKNSQKWLEKNETFKEQLEQTGHIESLKTSQVEILPDGFQLHRVRILKRKKDIKKVLPVINTPQEQPFINAFIKYYKTFTPGDHEMFPITRVRAWQLISKHTLHFCHLYRHTRATLLAGGRYYQLSESQLRTYLGWNDVRSSSSYVHITSEDLRSALQKKQDKKA